jgi:flagellar hook-length control protein FliK
MNESINVTSPNSSATTATGRQQTIRTASSGERGVEVTDIQDSEHSFSDSLSKVSERTDAENNDSSKEKDGNSLPLSAESGEQVAEDDHESLPTIIEKILNQPEQVGSGSILSVPNATEAQAIVQNNVQLLDNNVEMDAEVTEKNMSIDAGVKGSINTGQILSLQSALQNLASNISKGETTKTSANLESIDSGKSSSSVLDIDSQDLSLDKKIFSDLAKQAQVSSAGQPLSQQNILNEIQSSLLQKSDSSSLSPRTDTLNAPLTQAANSSPLILSTTPLIAEVREPFGRPGWSQAMGNQIVWMASQNIKSAEIRLNPAHLGPVEVRLEINEDQINVALSSRHAVVREAMEMTMPKLREMLENDGLNLSDSNISHQSFAEQREQHADNKSAERMSHSFSSREQASLSENSAVQQTVSTSMVDYFI